MKQKVFDRLELGFKRLNLKNFIKQLLLAKGIFLSGKRTYTCRLQRPKMERRVVYLPQLQRESPGSGERPIRHIF